MKIFGTGYDYEEEDLSTPFEHRIQSTKAVLFFQAPAFILITYILSLVYDFKFGFWVWFVISFFLLSLIYDWYKYLKNHVYVKIGAKIS